MNSSLMSSLLSIDVNLTSWPDITLEVSEHFYTILWVAIIFLVIILLNLVIITTGLIIYGAIFVIKSSKKVTKNVQHQELTT